MKHFAYQGFLAALLVFAFSCSSNLVAQTGFSDGERVEVEGARSYVLNANNLDEQYLIHVVEAGTQRIPRQVDRGLPVVYVLDGNTQFQLVSSIANILAGSRLAGFGNGIPQALIVSIGYVPDPELGPLENYNRMILQQRHRDYTPVLDDEFLAANPDLPPHSGAPSFLQFIEQEIKPFIADRYPVDSDDETLIGHSMGGLFVLWTLLNSPQSFDRYIAASPGLAWGNYRPLGQEIQFKEPESEADAKVHISVGGREESDMIGTASAFSQALEEVATELDVTFELIPGEDHASVIPSAITRGLQSVFE